MLQRLHGAAALLTTVLTIVALSLTSACGDERATLVRTTGVTGAEGPAGVFPPPELLVRVQPSTPLAETATGTPTDAAAPGDTQLPAAVVVKSVKRHGPTSMPTRIEAHFNQPMATFEGKRTGTEGGVFHFDPPVSGTTWWADPQTAHFMPDGAFPQATGMKAAVRAGLASASGLKLQQPYSFDFVTTRPRVTSGPWGSFRYVAHRRPEGSIALHFSNALSAEALKNALTVSRSDNLDALKSGSGTIVGAHVATTRPRAGSAAAFTIRPHGGFTVGSYFHFVIDRRLNFGTDVGMARDWSVVVRGPQRLKLSWSECGEHGCNPDSEWELAFNNPVDPASIRRCISVTPSLSLGRAAIHAQRVTFDPKNARAGTDYTLTLSEKCRDIYGSSLAKPTQVTLHVENFQANLAMVTGNGYLAPGKPGSRLAVPVTARATGPLKIRKRRITREALPDFVRAQLNAYGGYSLESVGDAGAASMLRGPRNPRKASRLGVRIDDVLGDGGLGIVHLEVEATNDGFYDEPPKRIALVQVTDTGLTVKSTPHTILVWTTSLESSSPLAGVEVELLDAAGKSLWRGRSDEGGLTTAPGMASFGAKKPRLVVASKGGDDLSFIDLRDWTTNIEPYRFNLPVAWDAEGDSLKGFVFTERGVYRPGETAQVKGYLRLDRDRRLELFEDTGFDVQVLDPEGELVLSREVTPGEVGDFHLDVPIAEGAPLGRYEVVVRALDDTLSGTATGRFRVEAYRPNRFEVKVTPDASGDPQRLKAEIQGRYLYGAPMKGATVRWWAHLKDASFSPAGFQGYRFTAIGDHRWWQPRDSASRALTNGEGELDGDGHFGVSVDLESVERDKGPLKVVIESEVSDVDEQVVAGRTTLRLHPGAFYLGVSRKGAVSAAGDTLSGAIVAVTPQGEQLGDVEASVTLSRRSWRSVKKTVAGGATSWVTEVHDEEISRQLVTTHATQASAVSLRPPRSGYYLIEARATDPAGKTIRASNEVWIWGDDDSDWARRDDERLQLVLDKKTYRVGESAQLLVQSPYRSAQALVTVERHGVLWQHTQTVHGAAPMIEVPITESMQPNAFVSVVLVRGSGQSKADGARSAMKMGYASFSVDLADKRLAVDVVPEHSSYRPGDTVRALVKLTDHDGAPAAGQVTFMAVDEGVLSLTGYRTPDPVAGLYKAKGIAVTTSESRHRLWAGITPTDEGMKSEWGGGGEVGGEATTYRSAFATTAAFLPAVKVGSDGRAEVSFVLPDNLGAFRLMAVAATADSRFGKGQVRIEVNKPLLVRPGLPRFIASGDVFEARAIVSALDGRHGKVAVSLATSGVVEVLGDSEVEIALGPGEVRAVTFRTRALAAGTASFAFKAARVGVADTEDAVMLTLPVNYPAAIQSAVVTGALGDEDSLGSAIEIPEWVHPEVGGVDVEITSSALGELLPGLSYLVEYPYGCVEQTTGGTLPLVALRGLVGEFSLPGISQGAVLTRVQAGAERLASMQTYSGGLAYWPGDNDPHPWGSVYGGMALVRAAALEGVDVDEDVLTKLKTFLGKILRQQVASPYSEWAAQMRPVEPFAAYVLALAGSPEPSYHSQLFESRADLPAFAKGLLALAIHEADGERSQMDALVTEMLDEVELDGTRALLKRPAGTRYYRATMDSDVRATAVALMTLMKVEPQHALIDKLARGLLGVRREGRWLNTQDNAFAILALADYFALREDARSRYVARVELDGEAVLSETMAGGQLSPRRVRIPMKQLRAANRIAISRDGDDAPLYYTLKFSYAPADIPRQAVTRGFALQRSYTYADGERAGQPVSELAPGQLVKVSLTMTTPTARRYVALDDPLPAGFEPVNTSFETTRRRLSGHTRTSWRQRRVFSHSEQRDDRVLVFSNHMPAGTHTHTYLARATTAGTFEAPAARIHEMYDPDVFGQSEALRVAIR